MLLDSGGEPFYEQNGGATYSSYSLGATACYGGTGGLMFPGSNTGAANGYLGPNLLFDPGAPPPPPDFGRRIVATAIAASSQEGARVMEKTTDGLELTGAKPTTDAGPFPTQNYNVEAFWLSQGNDPAPSITWDFGAACTTRSVYVWNMNYSSPWNLLGSHTAGVYASLDNATWNYVETLSLTLATGAANDPGELHTFASPFTARYVRFDVANFPGAPDGRVGLGEVAFYVPEPVSALSLALGALALLRRRARG